jgi:hypothetical protein
MNLHVLKNFNLFINVVILPAFPVNISEIFI